MIKTKAKVKTKAKAKTKAKTKAKAKNKKTVKYYFTSDTEQAIVDYCATEDIRVRTKLYIDQIQPALII